MTVNYEGFPEWRITREEYADLSVVAAPGIVYAEGDDLTPDQARKYAHALLAAADHADRHAPRLLPPRQQCLQLPKGPPTMTAHSDRIRQAEDAAGVYDDTPWEVGDILTYPTRENLPERTVLIDKDGDPWQRDGDWFIPGVSGSAHPAQLYGPYVVAWLPEADDE